MFMNANQSNKKLCRIKVSKKMQIIPLAALTLTLLLSQNSYAAEQPSFEENETDVSMMMLKGRHYKMKHMIKKLQLDAKQQAEIKTIRKTAKVKGKATYESLQRYHSQLSTLIRADAFDEQAVTVLHNDHQQNLAQAALTKAKVRYEILQVLSEQQKEKWFAFIENQQGKHQKERKEKRAQKKY